MLADALPVIRRDAFDDRNGDRKVAPLSGERGSRWRKMRDHEHPDRQATRWDHQIPAQGDARARVVHQSDRGMKPRHGDAHRCAKQRHSQHEKVSECAAPSSRCRSRGSRRDESRAIRRRAASVSIAALFLVRLPTTDAHRIHRVPSGTRSRRSESSRSELFDRPSSVMTDPKDLSVMRVKVRNPPGRPRTCARSCA